MHDLEILPQPTDTTCGPTCLHAVYRFFGDDVPLQQVIDEIPTLEKGGTLGVLLATHALRRGYQAVIYTYNLQVFDPTWFTRPGVDLEERLGLQLKSARKRKRRLATWAYLDYLEAGGEIRFEDLTSRLLERLIRAGQPIMAGVSSTYLYRQARQFKTHDDDIRGIPEGHFVVLRGYDTERVAVSVADPYLENEAFGGPYYEVGVDRLINSILLGIVTYDANLVLVGPRKERP